MAKFKFSKKGKQPKVALLKNLVQKVVPNKLGRPKDIAKLKPDNTAKPVNSLKGMLKRMKSEKKRP